MYETFIGRWNMTCEQRHLMLCQEQMHRKQGITRHQGHKDMENAQYGENTYLLTEKYLLATISSGKRFHSRESIGDVKIERNMNRKKLLIRLTSGALQNIIIRRSYSV